MIVKKLIEKVEGEANLKFHIEDGIIKDVTIFFDYYRGIEEILQKRAPRDALVITPRVCGICNHAHLLAAVHAIEDGLKKSGVKFHLTKKAQLIRDFTLSCELIQNHIKWFYLTLFPNLMQITKDKNMQETTLKAAYIAQTLTKALALFAGQWPHSSYAVPGGVSCDPTFVEIMQAKSFLKEAIDFFEKVLFQMSLEKFLSLNKAYELDKIKGDFGFLLSMLFQYNIANKGKSYDRFIVFGTIPYFINGKSIATTYSPVNLKYIQEYLQKDSFAKGVKYKDKFFEVGPLARAMVAKVPIIKSLHKRYKDALITRIYARVYESAYLLQTAYEILHQIDITQKSCTLNGKIAIDEIEGVGVVEAARGSLIHKIKVENGFISRYMIITPTQWNLANNGAAAKAMVGLTSQELATFIFRTFDICSVCTTH